MRFHAEHPAESFWLRLEAVKPILDEAFSSLRYDATLIDPDIF